MRNILFKLCSICLMIFLILGFAITAYTQTKEPTNKGKTILQTVTKPEKSLKSISLLDPARFNMKNQYVMSFSSVGGSGSMMGMFINTMEYRFNSPIIMRLKVAYQTKTGHMFGAKDAYTGIPNYQDGRLFIPSFDLIYTPSKNTSISFHFRDYTSMSPYYGYGSFGRYMRYGRYGYSPFIGY